MGKIMKQEKEELTGLYTADTAKMMIEEYLEKEQENVGMIVLDLDGFEQVNTMFDREKGDEFLLDTSYILQQSFSEDDIIYRSKEDEFVIFLKHCQENTNLNIRLYEPASGKPTAGTCRCWRRSWRWRTPGLARENGPAPPTSFWGCKWAWTWGS